MVIPKGENVKLITRNDCILLLTDLEQIGVDSSEYIEKQLNSEHVEPDCVEFINKHRPLDISMFYENLRRNYNQKKSKLYKEIVQVDEKEPKDIIVTLSALLTQIFIYSKKVDDKNMFLCHARTDEILKCLLNYSKTGDFITCQQFLSLVRSDLKALELKQ